MPRLLEYPYLIALPFLYREQFITEVTEFSLNYDLCGNGVLRRESKEKEKIDNLRKDLIKLEDGDIIVSKPITGVVYIV